MGILSSSCFGIPPRLRVQPEFSLFQHEELCHSFESPYRTAPPNIRIRIRAHIIRIATARPAIRRIIPITAEQEGNYNSQPSIKSFCAAVTRRKNKNTLMLCTGQSSKKPRPAPNVQRPAIYALRRTRLAPRPPKCVSATERTLAALRLRDPQLAAAAQLPPNKRA